MRRREFITALGGAGVWSVAAGTQGVLPVIGVLGSASEAAYRDRLTQIRKALAEGGFSEGRTIAVEYRWAEGQLDRLPQLAVDLVARKVNVIIATGGLQAPRAALSATSTIPVVFSTDGDPVKQGLVSSLSRPGANATGITVFSASLSAKRLDVFRELVPKNDFFAVLVNPTATQAAEQIRDAQEAGRSLGFEIRVVNAASDGDFEPVLATLGASTNVALLVSADPLFIARRQMLVAMVNRHAIPAIYGRRDFVASGGLVSYGANLAEPYYLMGSYVARILKGEKVTDLPVIQPTKFEFVVNRRTAGALSITIPDKLLALADEVID